jgi:peroxiredoxin
LGSFGSNVIANRNTFLIGPDGNIKQVWVKVNPPDSASEVLAAIP